METIEELQARIQELEQDNERLRAELDDKSYEYQSEYQKRIELEYQVEDLQSQLQS